MEHAPPPDVDTATAPGDAAPIDCIRLNVGQRPSGLAPLLTLGLATLGVGWGATSLLVALANSRSVSGTALLGSISVFVLAIVMRFAFIQTWRARAVDRRLRRSARTNLEQAMAAGVAPDIPTLCWCVAMAAGCSNSSPRALTLERLESLESGLGVRLPRVWVFDRSLTEAVALPAPAPALPEPGRRRAVLPRHAASIAADVVGVIGLLIAVLWAIVSTGAWFNAPRLQPAQALALFAPPPALAVVTLIGVALLNRRAARRDVYIERSADSPGLRATRATGAEPLAFPHDGFSLHFIADDTAAVSMPWARSIMPGPRLRLLAPEPWRTIEVDADVIVALPEPREVDVEHASRFKPVETIGEAPGRASVMVEVRLPESPPPLLGSLCACAAALCVIAGVALWSMTPGRGPLPSRAYFIGAGAGVVMLVLFAATAQDVFGRWIPARRRIARERLAARRELDAIGMVVGEARMPELCRLLALSYGCSRGDLRPLTHRRLAAAETRFAVRLPHVWLAHALADRPASAFAPLPPRTPALYKVTHPRAWQDRAATGVSAGLPIGMVALAAAGAGIIGNFSSTPAIAGLCCAAPAALCALVAVLTKLLDADGVRRGRFLLLSHRAHCLFRGARVRREERLAPPDAFTLFFDDGAHYTLRGAGTYQEDAQGAEDESDEGADGWDGRGTPPPAAHSWRVRVVAPAPWGEIEGRPCFEWSASVSGAQTQEPSITASSSSPAA